MRTFILGIILFASAVSFGQAPGYLGKKLAVSYDPAFFLSFIDMDNYYTNIPTVGIHVRHDLTATYAITRSLALGVVYKNLPTRYYDVYDLTEENYDPVNQTTQYVGFNGDIRRNTGCFGIIVQNFSFRKRGSIAPVGRYKSFELIMAKNSFKTIEMRNYTFADYESDAQYILDDREIPALTLIPFENISDSWENKPTFIFIFGSGSQAVYRDKFLLNFGWEIGVSFLQSMFSTLQETEPKTTITLSSGDYFYEEPDFFRQSLAAPFFLNFTIGGGYLVGK